MRRLPRSVVVILVVAVAGAAATVSAQGALDNAGFEAGAAARPASWSGLPGNDPYARIETTDEDAFAGEYSARISCTETDPRVGTVCNRMMQTVDATQLRGKTLTAGAMYKTEGIPSDHAAILRVEAVQSLAGLSFLISAVEVRLQESAEWTDICATLRVPEETSEIHISVGLEGLGTAWFDDVFASTDRICESETGQLTTHLPFSISSSVQPPVPELVTLEAPPTDPYASKPWTIAVYVAADLGFNPRDEIVDELQTCDQYNVVMLCDSSEEGGKTWLVERADGANRLRLLADHGEIDMSSERILAEFLEYCATWFPSERLMLLIYDHGGGWRGTAKEMTNRPGIYTWLSPTEIERGLEAVGGVDALLYTAPCNMASLETAHEIGGLANLTLAAEEYSGFNIWDGVLDSLGDFLKSDPGAPLETIGRFVVDTLDAAQSSERRKANGAPHPTFHQTAFWGGLVECVADAVDRLAAALIELIPGRQEEIVEIRKNSLAFRHGELVDIGDFAARCGEAIWELSLPANAVLDALGQTAFCIAGVPEFADSYGLSVFFPVFHDYVYAIPEYRTAGLAFGAQTQWDEFLEALYTDYN